MDNEIKAFDETELGFIKIAPNVIEVIAKLTTLEIEGVASISGGVTSEIAEFLGRNKNTTRGIKVEAGQKETIINISVILKYGYAIPTVAEKIQENVKNTVEGMTGMSVVEVNVNVNGVEFSDK